MDIFIPIKYFTLLSDCKVTLATNRIRSQKRLPVAGRVNLSRLYPIGNLFRISLLSFVHVAIVALLN